MNTWFQYLIELPDLHVVHIGVIMTHRIDEQEILKMMFEKEGISFANEKGWNALAEHVAVHNQYLTMTLGFNVSWDDALFSWYENVYTPLKRAIMTRSMRHAFPSKASGDLYLDVSDHWFYLKQKNENISAETAAYDFMKRNGEKRNPFAGFFSPQRPAGGSPVSRPSAA